MVAEMAMRKYDCAFVDDGHPIGTEICGIPVVGGTADLPKLRKDYALLVVGIGNNQFRAQVYGKAEALGYSFPNIVAPNAYVSPFAKVGHGCVLMQNVCIQNGAVVGNGVLLNAGVEVHCGAEVEDYVLLYTNSTVPERKRGDTPESAATVRFVIMRLCRKAQIFQTAPLCIKEVRG